jgi:hypothetical protein
MHQYDLEVKQNTQNYILMIATEPTTKEEIANIPAGKANLSAHKQSYHDFLSLSNRLFS